jgi:hypothetical protein
MKGAASAASPPPATTRLVMPADIVGIWAVFMVSSAFAPPLCRRLSVVGYLPIAERFRNRRIRQRVGKLCLGLAASMRQINDVSPAGVKARRVTPRRRQSR